MRHDYCANTSVEAQTNEQTVLYQSSHGSLVLRLSNKPTYVENVKQLYDQMGTHFASTRLVIMLQLSIIAIISKVTYSKLLPSLVHGHS